MSFALTERAWQAQVDPKKKLILLCLAKHHDRNLEDMVAWPSRETQIRDTGIPQSTLYRLREEMLRDGWIERLYSHPAARKYVEEIYRLHPDKWPSHNEKVSQNGNSQTEKSDSQNENHFSQNGNPYKESEPVIEPESEPSTAQARPADLAFDRFTTEFAKRYGTPYGPKFRDFGQLKALRGLLAIDSLAVPADWDQAVSNYFDTPLGGYTLAELCLRYATFRQCALDRYNRPTGGQNHETRIHTSQDTRQDDNIAAAHRLRSRAATGNRGSG